MANQRSHNSQKDFNFLNPLLIQMDINKQNHVQRDTSDLFPSIPHSLLQNEAFQRKLSLISQLSLECLDHKQIDQICAYSANVKAPRASPKNLACSMVPRKNSVVVVFNFKGLRDTLFHVNES